jgi:hypothetical protein
MGVGDCLARIAESQIGTRGDLESGRSALYGYLLATDAKLGAFEPELERTGFGEPSTRLSLLNPGGSGVVSRLQLFDSAALPELPVIFRIHNWCAAFVDWCVMQLLMNSPQTTSLTFAHRPKTALAWGLLEWGKYKHNHCEVFQGTHHMPDRGDIVVFNFHHTGICVEPGCGKHAFHSVEGNTTSLGGGNQGYKVAKRLRYLHQLRGFVRLPPKHRLGDYNISPEVSRMA